MPEIFTVEQRGVGKPDYSKEISLGQMRAGIRLRYNQTLKTFIKQFSPIVSPWIPWIEPPLAAGATSPYMDAETGEDMPYALAQGYTLSSIVVLTKGTQDRSLLAYLDGQFVAYVYIEAAGVWGHVNLIIPIGTAHVDPDGDDPHAYELRQENIGGAAMEGGGMVYAILEKVGSEPLPTTKTVKCKHCGHKHTVPLDTSKVICPECGELTIYYNLSKFRGTS